MNGAFFETYAVSEILKSYYNSGTRPDLYYYRDVDQREVDLLIVRGTDAWPVEIKRSSSPQNADKNFKVLSRLPLTIHPGIILCLSETFQPVSREAWLCPVGVL